MIGSGENGSGQLGVGVVGCGYWGPNLVRNLSRTGVVGTSPSAT